MTKIRDTKKQHFVPQFYLRLFKNENNLIQILDVINNRLTLPKPTSGVGYEKYFYAAETGVPDEISQQIEKWLQSYEDIIARELPQIINKIKNYQPVNDDDKYILSSLICMLWLRSPKMRAHLNKMDEDVTKQMMRFYAPQRVDQLINERGEEMTEERRLKLVKTLEDGSYKLKLNNAQHLQFMTRSFGFDGPGFINMFYNQKWKIYLAKGKNRFITIDSPVVEWWPPQDTFYGASFLERNKYFALTPEIFIELTYPMGSTKVKRETIFENRDNDVFQLNMLLMAHSHKYAYSHDNKILERLISIRDSQDPLLRIYYERFEKPWKEYYAKQKSRQS